MGEVRELCSISWNIDDPEKEGILDGILRELEKEFSDANFNIKVTSKKLVPFELALSVIIEVASATSTIVATELLKRLWQELQKRKLKPNTHELDTVQNAAERYLVSIGVTTYKLIERKQRGFMVSFVFQEKRKIKHYLTITNTDLKILDYHRKE